MSYERALNTILAEEGVETSTMMNAPCLRYRGSFFAMMLEKQDALIIKVSAERVTDLIARGIGTEFNVTKKRFKEWVLIPKDNEDDYEAYLFEALAYAQELRGN